MSEVSLTLVLKDYDFVAPLAAGDVDVEGVDLHLDRGSSNALIRTVNDSSVEAGELSFCRHILRLAAGDRRFVGIPFFPARYFRDRNFFVPRDSDLTEFSHLEGTRIGTNEWPSTGNTWNRAVLRESGVDIERIEWSVGPVVRPPKAVRPQGKLPENATEIGSDETLLAMLLDDELDALMCPISRFRGRFDVSDPTSQMVRLKKDYRASEKAYYRRTGLLPVSHLIGIRRDVYERQPWIVRSLFDALDESKAIWDEKRRRLTDTTPWIQAELEETKQLFGDGWRPNGIEPNRGEIETLCREVYEQGLIDEPFDPDALFTEFNEQVTESNELV